MHRFSVQIVCLSVIYLIKIAASSPQIAFPINSQLPPVAYASQPFEFTFSPNTFSGGVSDVSYTLTDQPGWLSIDSSTRRLSGTPVSSDIGAPGFALVASDGSGRTSSSATLVVLERRRLFLVTEDILPQLANAGVTSAPNTLVLQPQQPFSFTLPPSIFGETSTSTTFYAVSVDRSPLPSWIHFEPANMRFFGTTPPLLGLSPSQQSYTFSLVASSVVGFSEASVGFTVSIADRVLVFTSSAFLFPALPGLPLQTPALLADIRVNGVLVSRDQLVSASANSPSWLRFNESDLSFSGTPPEAFESLTFFLTVIGTNTNIANTTITIKADTKQDVTQTNLGNVSATIGSYFTYIVNEPPGIGGIVRTIINSTNLPTWLSFVASNKTLQGYIPNDVLPGSLVIYFTFSNGSRAVGGFLTLAIDPISSTSTKFSSTVTGTSITTSSATSQSSDERGSMPRGWLLTIILAVVLPVVAIFLLIGILFACWRRKRHAREEKAQLQTRNPSPTLRQQEISQDGDVLLAPGSVLPYNEMTEATASLPHVELSWAPDSMRKTRNRFSKKPRMSHGSLVGSSWDDLIDYQGRSRESLRPNPFNLFQRRRESNTSSSDPKTIRVVPKRPSRPDSLILPGQVDRSEGPHPSQERSVGLPKRLSAAGHGAGGGRNLSGGDNRSSWQTTLGSIPVVDRRRSTLIMGSFPQPPSHDALEGLGSTKKDAKLITGKGQGGKDLVEESRNHVQHHGPIAEAHHAHKMKMEHRGTSKLPLSASSSSILTRSTNGDGRTLPQVSENNEAPPLPQRSRARSSFSHSLGPMRVRASSAGQYPLVRETSMASSHQFDSAVSSDSQWEDESLVAAGSSADRAHRATDILRSADHVPPRVPPRSVTRGNSLSTRGRAASDPRQPRFMDQGDVSRSDRHSDQDSLRFI